MKRHLVAIAWIVLATAAVPLAAPLSAQAQSYPTRPVTIIVPYPAGGATDIIARTIGARLAETGIKDGDSLVWFGMAVPLKTTRLLALMALTARARFAPISEVVVIDAVFTPLIVIAPAVPAPDMAVPPTVVLPKTATTPV